MRFALLSALVLAMTSCAGAPSSYSVVIDGFTPEQTMVVVEACRTWERAVADPSRLRLFINVDMPCDLGHDDAICVLPTTMAEIAEGNGVERFGVTYHRRQDVQPQATVDPLGSLIYVATDTGDVKQTSEHELGHALGLVHTGPGTLMAPYVQEAARDVTPADVEQFLKVHGD
jgi:hypothetical protein